VDSDNEMLRLLSADGPLPELRDKMMLFGQFVGSWDLDVFGYSRDGTRQDFIGEWHFGWVLEGRGIQDVLIVRPLASSTGGGSQGGIGSTLRVYDSEMDAWWISWMSPVDREFSTLFARHTGDRIVLDGQWSLGQTGRRWQWIFSDISRDSFHWECRTYDDGDPKGRVVEEMYARRAKT
jgi:hypothetical protein